MSRNETRIEMNLRAVIDRLRRANEIDYGALAVELRDIAHQARVMEQAELSVNGKPNSYDHDIRVACDIKGKPWGCEV